MSVCLFVCTKFCPKFFLHHRGSHWGGWARRRQHICCSSKTRRMMEGWAGALPNLDLNWAKLTEFEWKWIKSKFCQTLVLGQWKTNFDERWLLIKDNLWWKTTFNRRWPLMEDDLRWKTIFVGIQPFMEDDFWWKPRKTTFDLWLMLSLGVAIEFIDRNDKIILESNNYNIRTSITNQPQNSYLTLIILLSSIFVVQSSTNMWLQRPCTSSNSGARLYILWHKLTLG